MHLLMVSIDRLIFEKESAVERRMIHYASLVGKLDIIALNAPADGTISSTPIRIADSAFIYPIQQSGKFAAFLKAFRVARHLADHSTVLTVQDPFELGLFGLLVRWATRCRLHVQVHIDFFSPYFRRESMRQRIQSIIAPLVLKRADGVRVVSSKIRDYLISSLRIATEKITVVPIFSDVRSARQAPITADLHRIFPELDWIVLVAARYVKQKNIPLAIEAFDIFRREAGRGGTGKNVAKKVGLVIAGSGPEEGHIRKMVKDKGMDECVKMGSWTREFFSCMKTCDIFLMSSDYEGWGMTVVEATSLGKPIIMTDVGCAGEFIQNEKNGLVTPVRDASAMAIAVGRYYDDQAFASNMAQEAGADALTHMISEENDRLQKYSWKNSTNNS